MDEKLKKRFANTYKFSKHYINKFILLLRKGVYPNANMNDWRKFNETSLSEKEYFDSHLIIEVIEDITDTDYTLARRVCKGF